jgi:ribosomal protein S13
LREGKKINGVLFYSSFSLKEFFFKYSSFGFSKKLYNIFLSRLESRFEKKIKEMGTSKLILVYNMLLDTVPLNKNLKKKMTFNIFMLDLINTYKGLRHSFGLPVRGQRT